MFLEEQNGTDAYWSALASEVIPSCRSTPTNKHDVSIVVVELVKSNCKFAVRGGGHM